MASNGMNSSLYERRKSEGMFVTPGPGYYFVNRDTRKRSISFAKASRSTEKYRLSPGPGSYNIPSDFGKGPKVKFTSGRTSSDIGCAPGPSDYSPCYRFSSIKYTFPKNNGRKNFEITPGPADYNLVYKNNAPRVTIGKAKRTLIDIKNYSFVESEGKKKEISRRSSHCFQTQIKGFEERGKENEKREKLSRKRGGENCAPKRSSSVKKGKM